MRDVFNRWNEVRTNVKCFQLLLQKPKHYGGTVDKKTYVVLEILQTFNPVVTQIELFQID